MEVLCSMWNGTPMQLCSLYLCFMKKHHTFVSERPGHGEFGKKSKRNKVLKSELGGLLPLATDKNKGLMPIGQVLTNEFVLKSGEVSLLSTSEDSVAYNVVVWHPWRGIASYQILICRDDSRKIYKVISLCNLLSQKFYVKIGDYNIISMYLKNNSEGSMNVRIQPVTSFRTNPVIATLPEDAIEVSVE